MLTSDVFWPTGRVGANKLCVVIAVLSPTLTLLVLAGFSEPVSQILSFKNLELLSVVFTFMKEAIMGFSFN